jgi:hypothetical protein
VASPNGLEFAGKQLGITLGGFMQPRIFAFAALPAVLALYMPSCRTPAVTPTMPSAEVPIAQLWEKPDDIAARDLFAGEWGLQNAPDPAATYSLVKLKTDGVNPGMTVADPKGRRWRVKQPPDNNRAPEGPIEVVLSRILSAVGYHQPPVYYLDSFTLKKGKKVRIEPGGRFRLEHETLEEVGDWSWQKNPFVGSDPYEGLLVILVMMNSSDLKNSNNSLYRVRSSEGVQRWYVVRDLGTALGDTGRFEPRRGDIERFERLPFILGVEQGFVRFEYQGFHQELIQQRISPAHVRWASELLGELNERQWHDAFRAGGYPPALADRYIRRITTKIEEGRRVGDEGEN